MLKEVWEHSVDNRDIINDAKTENTQECCGVPMQVDNVSTEYWGNVKTHTEYYCRVCGELLF